MVRAIQLAHVPPELTLFVALFRDVKNAAFLREQLLAANADFEYAFIDATTIISTKHALAAAFRAINDFLNERLKSRNVHSEIVFSLSPNNNIGEAFRRFGVSETTGNLLVVKVATQAEITEESVTRHLSENIDGQEVAFEDASLRTICDTSRIKKLYKIASIPARKTDKQVNGEAENNIDQTKNLEVQILGAMALRGAA
ncbi:uncharacterized protein A1O9_06806 [Exophiala aquamarina CBS 119918]|uniref:EKC/KEOPS complex subunit CGI121 n=1 Tax=Exophiala aquamarina CBS 119918 TaxID=1182545 RepID=A0A072PA31_9EURO|nr:uncharacterized protein A1O9_06806 [Exophiala aquamarina CBS 119918]KEF56617.1 hypothetical protein A1O9_06806 [Exophiala aquamarina CBS 119918]